MAGIETASQLYDGDLPLVDIPARPTQIIEASYLFSCLRQYGCFDTYGTAALVASIVDYFMTIPFGDTISFDLTGSEVTGSEEV